MAGEQNTNQRNPAAGLLGSAILGCSVALIMWGPTWLLATLKIITGIVSMAGALAACFAGIAWFAEKNHENRREAAGIFPLGIIGAGGGILVFVLLLFLP